MSRDHIVVSLNFNDLQPEYDLRREGVEIMETSTIIFVITLVIAFVFLRWLITPIPRDLPSEFNPNRAAEATASGSNVGAAANTTAAAAAATGSQPVQRRSRREVTDSMIEVVQAIAPQLTVGQIRYDLERSGSVEATIERFMETGTLPFPPGESPTVVNDTDSHSAPVKAANTSLIDKYNLSNKISEDHGEEEEVKSGTWGESKKEREDILSKRREEMILKARKRLASQLSNEI